MDGAARRRFAILYVQTDPRETLFEALSRCRNPWELTCGNVESKDNHLRGQASKGSDITGTPLDLGGGFTVRPCLFPVTAIGDHLSHGYDSNRSPRGIVKAKYCS
jgi:hypothetical protein